jgi:hypothetical protein
MYLRKVVCEGGDSVHLTQDRVQWRTVVNAILTDISGTIKGGKFLEQLSDSQLLKENSASCSLLNF